MGEASGDAIDAHSTNDLADQNTVGSATGIQGNGRDYEASSSECHSIADASQTGLDFGNEDFTIAGWVKGEGFSGFTLQYILSKGNETGEAGYAIRWDWSSDRLQFRVANAGFSVGTVTANNLGSPSDATWYFVVCKHDATGNTLTISVNNGTEDSAAWSNGCAGNAHPFRLGARDDNSGNAQEFFDGILDEWGIWGRLLTADEITELYNAGAGRDYDYISGGAAGEVIGRGLTRSNRLYRRRLVA